MRRIHRPAARGTEAHLRIGNGREHDVLAEQHRLFKALQHDFQHRPGTRAKSLVLFATITAPACPTIAVSLGPIGVPEASLYHNAICIWLSLIFCAYLELLKARERLTPGPYLRFRHSQKNARISSRKTTSTFRTMIALSIKAPIRFSSLTGGNLRSLLLHCLLQRISHC